MNLFRICNYISFLLVFSSVGSAAVVLRTNDEPLYGYVKSEDGGGVTVRAWVGENRFIERKLLPSEVKQILPTVDPQRLAELTPKEPVKYKLYAEELHARRRDIEAREMAIRLFLIHARLVPEAAGGDLLAASELARTPEEARKLKVLAFEADPEKGIGLLKENTQDPDSVSLQPLSEDVKTELRTALREVRTGNRNSAIQSLQRNQLRSALQRYKNVLTFEEIVDARNHSGPLPQPLLLRIVQVEIQLMLPRTEEQPKEPDPTAKEDAAISWSKAVSATSADPVKPLRLETVTEFDPEKNTYRDGVWQLPTEDLD
jgi:hypothetical protein